MCGIVGEPGARGFIPDGDGHIHLSNLIAIMSADGTSLVENNTMYKDSFIQKELVEKLLMFEEVVKACRKIPLPYRNEENYEIKMAEHDMAREILMKLME